MWRREYVENVTKDILKKIKIKKRITLALNACEVFCIVTQIWIAYLGCSKQGKVFYKNATSSYTYSWLLSTVVRRRGVVVHVGRAERLAVVIGKSVTDVAGRHRAQVESIKIWRRSDPKVVVHGGQVPPVRVPEVDDEGVVVVASEKVNYLKSNPVIS